MNNYEEIKSLINASKKALKLNHLKCLSFNNREAWEYDPNILLTDIKQYLISHRIKTRTWEDFL